MVITNEYTYSIWFSVVCVQVFFWNGRNYGQITLGFFITIMYHVKLSLVLRDFFAKNSTHIFPQPPYSPDLTPCDLWLFSKLRKPERVQRFDTIKEKKPKRSMSWRQYRKKTVPNVSRPGKSVGKSTFYRRRITLKDMQFFWKNK